MLRGKSAKLIGKYLDISPRTIEEHISNLKNKFKVKNKSELFDEAIQKGFFNIIPESLFKTQLSITLKE